MTLTRTLSRVRQRASVYRDIAGRALGTAGVVDSADKLNQDAQEYWRATTGENWKSHSHWRDADVFGDGRLWSEVGRRHLDLFDRMARVSPRSGPYGAILEWGCGGGANAVHFAPRGSSFVGVEISQDSLDECGRQVAAATSTPYLPILIDAGDPEAVIGRLTEPCDLFTSFYVFELITSQEYGARLLRIAGQVLAEDGLAFIQVKYDTGAFRTRPRRRGYRRGLTDMTTYRIDEFWSLAESCGLVPEAVHLVPKNELDERYAYFLLSKPADADRPG
jgi:hypothetical protein